MFRALKSEEFLKDIERLKNVERSIRFFINLKRSSTSFNERIEKSLTSFIENVEDFNITLKIRERFKSIFNIIKALKVNRVIKFEVKVFKEEIINTNNVKSSILLRFLIFEILYKLINIINLNILIIYNIFL